MLLLSMAVHPGGELTGRVLRESAVLADTQCTIHHSLCHPKRKHSIDNGSKRRSQRAHEISGSKGGIAQLVVRLVVLEFAHGYDVAYLHSRRTGHLTALAVEAVLQCIVEESRVLEPVSFSVRA